MQAPAKHTISPQATFCRNNPLRVASVKYPSLPAINSRQSLAICCTISPASWIWCGFKPNIMHLPTRRFVMVSHRGSMSCGFGAVGFELGDSVRALFGWKEEEKGRIKGIDGCRGARTMRWLRRAWLRIIVDYLCAKWDVEWIAVYLLSWSSGVWGPRVGDGRRL